jgi:hypothetical protein
MSSAIEQVVNVFVSLGNRRRLEDMKLQRQGALVELQGPVGSERACPTARARDRERLMVS